MLYSENTKSRLLIETFKKHPVFFCKEILGINLFDYQEKIINSVRDYKYTTVKSAHNIGKTWLAAQIALWFLFSHPPSKNKEEQTVVITTAPTNRQVEQQLWGNIRSRFESSTVKLPGKVFKKALLEVNGQRWYGFGFAASDTERFQGFHATNMLVIADEAAGIPEQIFTGISAITTSENNKLLLIGNPTTTSGTFFNSFRDPKYNKISVSVFDTLNFKTFGIIEDDILNNTWKDKITDKLPCEGTITPHHVYDLFLEWGANSIRWNSRVRAEFPEQSEDTLFPLIWLEQSVMNHAEYSKENDLKMINNKSTQF